MDPLSITASVVGITTAALQSIQFLSKTIDNVRDAPSTIKDISADLHAMEPVLQNLDKKLQSDSSKIILSDQIGPAVENCDRACKTLRLQIEHWIKHSKEDKIFWVYRWKIGLFGQERIRTFKGQLSDCKDTLNTALSTAIILALTSEKELKKEQKDIILSEHEAEIHRGLTRAGKEIVEIEHSLQQLTVGGGNGNEESEQSRQELIQELKNQQAANTIFREMCEEVLSRTVFERTRQKIKGVKATQDSTALAGFINTSGEELKINQDISDVTAEYRSFAVAGVVKNLDFKDLRPKYAD